MMTVSGFVQSEMEGFERPAIAISFKASDELIYKNRSCAVYGTKAEWTERGKSVKGFKNIFTVPRDPEDVKFRPNMADVVYTYADKMFPVDKIGADFSVDKQAFEEVWNRLHGKVKKIKQAKQGKISKSAVCCPICHRKARMTGQIPLI